MTNRSRIVRTWGRDRTMLKAILTGLALAGVLARPAIADDHDATATMALKERYSDYLAKKHDREVGRVLARGFDPAFSTELKALPDGGCAAMATAYANDTEERGLLFAAMYRRFGPRAGRSASNVLRNWVPALPANDPRAAWYAISDCTVQRAPAATRDFVRATEDDPEERRALAKVVAVLPKCLPGGREYHLSPTALKGLLAETIYAIDFAPSPGDR